MAGENINGKKYFNLKIITPRQVEFDQLVYRLQAKSEVGWRGFLANSGPTFMRLKPGEIVYGDETGDDHRQYVKGGILEVQDGNITILTKSIEPDN